MPESPTPVTTSCRAQFITNTRESSGLIRLDLALEQPFPFLPGHFAMINLAGPAAFVFSRPLSILAATETTLSFLYRVVGRGTAALADLRAGSEVVVLGPLGHPFPDLDQVGSRPVVLVAGGVGLPPLHGWMERFGRPDDLAFFGGRDGSDIPWELLGGRWQVSVDRDVDVPPEKSARQGLVTELVKSHPALQGGQERVVLTCGPLPLLRAVAALCEVRGWECHVSLEEHMGCGYGACKGCVVPVKAEGAVRWRNATCCEEGPVFSATEICWDRCGVASAAGGGKP